jgi:hypothetical protein
MLIFTNRTLNKASSNAEALTNVFNPFLDTLNSVSVQPSANGSGWKTSQLESSHTDATALKRLSEVLGGNRPVLVYLHGNNNSPATCFTRCQQLETQYDVAVVGYSWASEGFLPNGEDQAGLDATKPNTDNDEEALSSVKSKAHLKEGWIARKARRYGQAKLNAQQS